MVLNCYSLSFLNNPRIVDLKIFFPLFAFSQNLNQFLSTPPEGVCLNRTQTQALLRIIVSNCSTNHRDLRLAWQKAFELLANTTVSDSIGPAIAPITTSMIQQSRDSSTHLTLATSLCGFLGRLDWSSPQSYTSNIVETTLSLLDLLSTSRKLQRSAKIVFRVLVLARSEQVEIP